MHQTIQNPIKRTIILGIILFFAAGASMYAQDVSTSFEFTDTSGSFTLGTSPRTVTFEGGEAKTVGDLSLYTTGLNAWLIGAGQTGTITFETPSIDLTFFAKDQDSQVLGLITAFNGQEMVASFNGSLNFQEISLDQPVARIEVRNNAEVGSTLYVAIDDFRFTAGAPNQSPVAMDDSGMTEQGMAVTLSVLDNDSDPDGDPISVSAVTDPANGQAVINNDNTITYTPDAEFLGQDSFMYTLFDGREGTDTAVVTIEVVALPDPLPSLVFTQFASGEIPTPAGQPGGGVILNRTRIILRNNGEENIVGRVRFQDAQGEPVAVVIDEENVSLVEYSLDPFQSVEIVTDGTGPLSSGAVRVLVDEGSDAGLEGTLVFDLLGNFVSVPASPLRSTHQVYVSQNENENSGVALFNPSADSSSTFEVILLDAASQERTSKMLTLAPMQQLSLFVSDDREGQDLFPEFFAENPDFKGSLNIVVQEGDPEISVLGLLQTVPGNALIAVSTSARAFERLP